MRSATAGRHAWRSAKAAVVAFLVAITAGTALVTGPLADPAAAEETGPWAAGWSTDFTGDSLPVGCQPYGGTYSGGANAWSPSQVSVSDGLLHVRLERKQTEGRAWTSGGLGCWGKPQTYGRFEIRARIPRGAGIDSYFALWPTQGGEGRWTGVEFLAPGTETAYVTNGWGPAKQGTRVVGSYADGFHTYVVEWTPQGVRITRDGVQLFVGDRSYSGPRYLVLVVSNGDTLSGLPNAATPLPAEFLVDRIRVDRYQPGAATAEPSAAASSATQAVPSAASVSGGTGAASAVAQGVGTAQLSPVEAGVGEVPGDPSATSGLLLWLVIGPLLVLVLAGAVRAYVHSPQRAARAAGVEPGVAVPQTSAGPGHPVPQQASTPAFGVPPEGCPGAEPVEWDAGSAGRR